MLTPHPCSDERNSDLFNAMLGGLGQCGIITKVVMRLMAAPTNVLFIKMDYDDLQSASADLALLAKDGRFHHLDGRWASPRRELVWRDLIALVGSSGAACGARSRPTRVRRVSRMRGKDAP